MAPSERGRIKFPGKKGGWGARQSENGIYGVSIKERTRERGKKDRKNSKKEKGGRMGRAWARHGTSERVPGTETKGGATKNHGGKGGGDTTKKKSAAHDGGSSLKKIKLTLFQLERGGQRPLGGVEL